MCVQLMTRCPANDTAEALTGSLVCHQMGWGKVPLPPSLTVLPCFDRHKHQTTERTACLAVPVLLAQKKNNPLFEYEYKWICFKSN